MSDDINLYLVGTNHCDLNGYDRLMELYDYLKPEKLLIEISKNHPITNRTYIDQSEVENLSDMMEDALGGNLSKKQKENLLRFLWIDAGTKGYEFYSALEFQLRNPETDIIFMDSEKITPEISHLWDKLNSDETVGIFRDSEEMAEKFKEGLKKDLGNYLLQ